MMTYEQIRASAERTGDCPVCGKPSKRRRTFEQTVNPWNRNADGSSKSRQEVVASVLDQAKAWEPTPDEFTHAKCRGAAPVGTPPIHMRSSEEES